MTSAAAATVDRRHRRRQETIEEILGVAVEVMVEHGAGGLTLGEVARRMGIRPPSLYGYFDSKNALYDAVFARGWSALNEAMQPVRDAMTRADDEDASSQLLLTARELIGWALAHPAHAQLMFWRPVPGFEPSPEAYLPAQATVAETRAVFELMQRRGWLQGDVDDAVSAWIVLNTGVISQQLANAPHQTLDDGTCARLLPELVSMFLARYGSQGGPHARQRTARTRGAAAADQPRGGRRSGDGAARRDAGAAAKPRRR